MTNVGLGVGSCIVSFVILIVMVFVMRFFLHIRNKRRQAAQFTLEAPIENVEFFDLTDENNPVFVYVY